MLEPLSASELAANSIGDTLKWVIPVLVSFFGLIITSIMWLFQFRRNRELEREKARLLQDAMKFELKHKMEFKLYNRLAKALSRISSVAKLIIDSAGPKPLNDVRINVLSEADEVLVDVINGHEHLIDKDILENGRNLRGNIIMLFSHDFILSHYSDKKDDYSRDEFAKNVRHVKNDIKESGDKILELIDKLLERIRTLISPPE